MLPNWRATVAAMSTTAANAGEGSQRARGSAIRSRSPDLAHTTSTVPRAATSSAAPSSRVETDRPATTGAMLFHGTALFERKAYWFQPAHDHAPTSRTPTNPAVATARGRAPIELRHGDPSS